MNDINYENTSPKTPKQLEQILNAVNSIQDTIANRKADLSEILFKLNGFSPLKSEYDMDKCEPQNEPSLITKLFTTISKIDEENRQLMDIVKEFKTLI